MPVLMLVPMVFGAAIGVIVRYLLPGREWVGLFLSALAPAAAAGAVWTTGAMLGAADDDGWTWLGSLTAALAVAIALPEVLPRRRERADAAYLAELTGRSA